MCIRTPPHVMEPKFPGVCENIINLGQCWGSEKLREQSEKIIDLTLKNKALHSRASRFLAASGTLLSDTYRLALDGINTEKISRAASRLCQKEFKGKGLTKGSEVQKFLSAFTPEGLIFFENTVKTFADKI